MINFEQNQKIQYNALVAMQRLAVTRPAAELFMKHHAARYIRHAFKNHAENREIQVQACLAVEVLGRTPSLKADIFNDGLLHYVVDIMKRKPTDPEIQRAGALALARASCTYALIHLDISNVIVTALKNHQYKVSVIIAFCKTIKNLCDLDYNAKAFMHHELHTELITVLTEHLGDSKLQYIGIETIGRLGVFDTNKLKLWNSGIGDHLAVVCRRYQGDKVILKTLFHVLNNMATVKEVAEQITQSSVMKDLVIGALRNQDSKGVQELAVHAIYNIGIWSTDSKRKLKEVGADKVCQQAMVRHNKSKTIQKQGRLFLESIKFT